MRIAMNVEYDGAAFCGWQTQAHGVETVQQTVEKALGKVADHPVNVVCAGRTDTGVHATGQVIHFDTDAIRDMRAWVFGTNANVPESVCIRWAHPVDESFHARFSAQRRRYCFVIFNRDVRPSFLTKRVTWEFRPLDVARMQAAARYLVGTHDFTSYRAVACQAKNPVRTLHELTITAHSTFIYIEAEADGFLHHMVRNIAGVLMTIGFGKEEPEWAQSVLHAKDRTLGGVTAQPHGLYLIAVRYPEKYKLPALSPWTPVW